MIPQKHRKTIAAMRKRLTRLRDLAVGEGADYYRDVAEVGRRGGRGPDRALGPASGQAAHGHDRALQAHRPAQVQGRLRLPARHGRATGWTSATCLARRGRTLVFLNNVCTSKEVRSLAAETIANVRRDLKSVLGGKSGQDLLLSLLKFSSDKALDNLRRTYGERGGTVASLARHLKELEERAPLELLRDFRRHPYRTVTPEVEADRALMGRCLTLGKGTLDAMFQDAPPDDATRDGRILQIALMVNMQSFLADDMRSRTLDLDVEEPSSLVRETLDKVDHFRTVIPEFNRVCARKEG